MEVAKMYNDQEFLEENLMKLSNQLLQNKDLHYNDDIAFTLKQLYCLKEIKNKSEEKKMRAPKPSLLNKLSSLFFISKKSNKKYKCIDGKIYNKSYFISWKKAYPILKHLQKEIKNNSFNPDW